MNISWRGQSFFEIQTPEAKVIIDPYDASIGLKPPKTEADVVLITHNHPDHANIKSVSGSPFIIDSLGEYEIKGVFVKGILGFHDKDNKEPLIIYNLESGGIKMCHLSDLGQKELTDEQIEAIGEVDILMIPVGGTYTVDAKAAKDIVSQIEPRVVIPMHYKIPKLKVKLDGVESFLKQMGAEKTETEKKFKVSQKNLPVEETKVVVLEP